LRILIVSHVLVFSFAHYKPLHQSNESLAAGVLSPDPTEKGYQISCCVIVYTCKMQFKIFTIRSHIYCSVVDFNLFLNTVT